MYQQYQQPSISPDHEPGFDHPQAHQHVAADSEEEWVPGLDPQDQVALNEAKEDADAIVEEIPSEKDSLGRFSVLMLIFNRMIGSGIFNSSSVIFYNTQSIGIALLLWLCGVCVALSGIILYIELGLTVPRWQRPDGVKISTPRSGGELPYLNYFLKAPKFLATCLFGVSFLVFGNTATNSVAFAVAVHQASGATATAGKVAAIALAANTFSCLLHSMSRKWGIRLNNLLGSLKLLMLVLMIIFGLRWLDRDVAADNFNSQTSFEKTDKSPTGVYRYGEALVYAIFPFGGFHQANYVLAEIKHPHKNFARTSGFGVLVICCLFMTLTVLYAAIIPKAILFTPDLDVALEYFSRTVGRGAADPQQVIYACGGLRSLSALGNIIVFTFTAARVKQEVAKEGVFPFSVYFASSYEFSFRRGFRRVKEERAVTGAFLYTEKSPAAALALHWTVTSVLILAAILGTGYNVPNGEKFSHLPGYSLLVTTYAYGLDVIWFSCIGIGMLYLRLWPGSRWRFKSPIPHMVGIIAAVVFTATNVVPLITIWIHDPAQKYITHSDNKVDWFAGQTTAIAVVGAAFLYWVGFRFYLNQKRTRGGLVWEVVRTPIFWAGSGQGSQGLVQIYEIIRFKWRAWAGNDEILRGKDGAEGPQLDESSNMVGNYDQGYELRNREASGVQGSGHLTQGRRHG
ncbi:putative high-affinity methionine permease [Podospora australis]|uniref:High-affinity methionine permease n=1 Tax=Podospora australis TaxID=1536484 RepID=A0AAN6WT31_9PEZI|nr:putative high-affinity methionine permease [Podospora australis]